VGDDREFHVFDFDPDEEEVDFALGREGGREGGKACGYKTSTHADDRGKRRVR